MWYLEIFSKETEELIEEVPLRMIRAKDVRAVLGRPETEDVHDGGHPVTGGTLEVLLRLAGCPIDEGADYFLAYTAPRLPLWAVGEEPTVFWRNGVLVNLHDV
ncbi:hypothetical protein [Kitasatospora sp. NPDC057223]|uniref:DUF7683 domain-containing protein n=1 Tax=Kitasatospora sp. NPDC057223 TaxID=3346055 RepID=UPI00362C3B1B